MKRIGVVAILLLAFCGLADAAYLAQHAANGMPIICNVQGLSDCNTVVKSPYSQLFGIPLADYGVFFFGVIFVLAALELFLFDRLLRRVLQIFSIIGILASAYFVSVQAFVIGALCIYCLTSASITLLILIFASLIEPVKTKKDATTTLTVPPPPPSPPMLTMPPAA
jgi:uncharacterized membrane protein